MSININESFKHNKLKKEIDKFEFREYII